MAAIVGQVNLNGKPIDSAAFQKAIKIIGVYGPNPTTNFVNRSFGFACQHLEIGNNRTFEEKPIILDNTLIVADAVLDYRASLARQVFGADVTTSRFSDSELIIRGYKKFSFNVFSKLYGDFAFAIYDTEKKQLLLARDHIGTRPLYYHKRGMSITFSTDIRAVIELSRHDGSADVSGVAHYMFNPTYHTDRTFFSGIKKVMPGNYVQVTADNIRHGVWWAAEGRDIPLLKDKREYADLTRELVENSVSERTQTEFPVASHLSGGMDSGAVSLIASDLLNQRGRKLTAGYSWSPSFSGSSFPDFGAGDERHNIKKISEIGIFPFRFNNAGAETCLEYLRRSFEFEGTATVFDELPIIKMAEHDGIRVLLSGWGGDECLSNHGEGYISLLLKSLRFREAASYARNRVGRHNSKLKALSHIWTHGILPFFPERLYRPFDIYSHVYPNHCYGDPSFLNGEVDFFAEIKNRLRVLPQPDAFYKQLILRGHLAERMETWAAWTAPSHYQYRYPLTDRLLLESLLSIPTEVLYGGTRGREFARVTFSNVVPNNLTKFDVASEARRNRCYLETWKELNSMLEEGCFLRNCAWLDMARFRAAISISPDAMASKDVAMFAELMTAVRLYFMCFRFERSA